jgi:hypothetical protein
VKYYLILQVFRENEVDLDIIRELTTSDLADMGIVNRDIQLIVEATKRLPPGSFR